MLNAMWRQYRRRQDWMWVDMIYSWAQFSVILNQVNTDFHHFRRLNIGTDYYFIEFKQPWGLFLCRSGVPVDMMYAVRLLYRAITKRKHYSIKFMNWNFNLQYDDQQCLLVCQSNGLCGRARRPGRPGRRPTLTTIEWRIGPLKSLFLDQIFRQSIGYKRRLSTGRYFWSISFSKKPVNIPIHYQLTFCNVLQKIVCEKTLNEFRS